MNCLFSDLPTSLHNWFTCYICIFVAFAHLIVGRFYLFSFFFCCAYRDNFGLWLHISVVYSYDYFIYVLSSCLVYHWFDFFGEAIGIIMSLYFSAVMSVCDHWIILEGIRCLCQEARLRLSTRLCTYLRISDILTIGQDKWSCWPAEWLTCSGLGFPWKIRPKCVNTLPTHQWTYLKNSHCCWSDFIAEMDIEMQSFLWKPY